MQFAHLDESYAMTNLVFILTMLQNPARLVLEPGLIGFPDVPIFVNYN
jgi:hypothetical protein